MQASKNNWLIVVGGPTASGKTALAIEIAKYFSTEILSADSRQFYKELTIGVARPSDEELRQVKHHFIAHQSIQDDYSAGAYASDALTVLNRLFKSHRVVVMVGGSGLFVQAVTKGFHQHETRQSPYRNELELLLQVEGVEGLLARLRQLDPQYIGQLDNNNPHRIMRAIERVLETGKPHAQQYAPDLPERPFQIIEIAIERDRDELYERINHRVDLMMDAGLLQEVQSLESFKSLNALQTVGYKELFDYLEGKCTLHEAVEKIKQNTRRYAKRQLTWMRNKTECHWVKPTDSNEVIRWIEGQLT